MIVSYLIRRLEWECKQTSSSVARCRILTFLHKIWVISLSNDTLNPQWQRHQGRTPHRNKTISERTITSSLFRVKSQSVVWDPLPKICLMGHHIGSLNASWWSVFPLKPLCWPNGACEMFVFFSVPEYLPLLIVGADGMLNYRVPSLATSATCTRKPSAGGCGDRSHWCRNQLADTPWQPGSWSEASDGSGLLLVWWRWV